jgi:hypothetical protein
MPVEKFIKSIILHNDPTLGLSNGSRQVTRHIRRSARELVNGPVPRSTATNRLDLPRMCFVATQAFPLWGEASTDLEG